MTSTPGAGVDSIGPLEAAGAYLRFASSENGSTNTRGVPVSALRIGTTFEGGGPCGATWGWTGAGPAEGFAR